MLFREDPRFTRLGPDFGRPGSVLLSRILRYSTIGAEAFHGRVRDGIGCFILAITTRSSEISPEPPHLDFQMAHTSGKEASPSFLKSHGNKGLKLAVLIELFGFEFSWRPSIRALKPIEQLVPVSYTHRCASTPGLST